MYFTSHLVNTQNDQLKNFLWPSIKVFLWSVKQPILILVFLNVKLSLQNPKYSSWLSKTSLEWDGINRYVPLPSFIFFFLLDSTVSMPAQKILVNSSMKAPIYFFAERRCWTFRLFLYQQIKAAQEYIGALKLAGIEKLVCL